jgi:hypothetical protein
MSLWINFNLFSKRTAQFEFALKVRLHSVPETVDSSGVREGHGFSRALRAAFLYGFSR